MPVVAIRCPFSVEPPTQEEVVAARSPAGAEVVTIEVQPTNPWIVIAGSIDTVVTRNVSDFGRGPELAIEDWSV